MRRDVAALAVVAALATSCGATQLKEGDVTGKHYEPARQTIVIIPIVTSCGKYGCTYIFIPYVVYRPERWVLELRACAPDKNGDEKCRTGVAYVDSTVYENTEIGSHYVRVKGDTAPNPDVRLRRA